MVSKREERWFVDAFLRLSRLDASAEQREGPDFLLNVGGESVGLEVTKLLNPQLKRSREAQRVAARMAQKDLAPDQVSVFLGWRSNDFDPRHTRTAGQKIPHAVRLAKGGVPPWEALELAGLDDLMDDLIVEPHETTYVGGGNMYEVGGRPSTVQAALLAKEEKLAKYRADLQNTPMWLLLASGIDCSDVLASRVGDVLFVSGFDRAFILDAIKDELREIRVAAAST